MSLVMTPVLVLDETAMRGHQVNLLMIGLHFSHVLAKIKRTNILVQQTLFFNPECKIMTEYVQSLSTQTKCLSEKTVPKHLAQLLLYCRGLRSLEETEKILKEVFNEYKTVVAWFKSYLLLNIQMYNMSSLHKYY